MPASCVKPNLRKQSWRVATQTKNSHAGLSCLKRDRCRINFVDPFLSPPQNSVTHIAHNQTVVNGGYSRHGGSRHVGPQPVHPVRVPEALPGPPVLPRHPGAGRGGVLPAGRAGTRDVVPSLAAGGGIVVPEVAAVTPLIWKSMQLSLRPTRFYIKIKRLTFH